MQLTDRIAAMIEPGLEAMGYEIVRVQLSGGADGRKGAAQTLQIMCDRQDEKPITVEDCAEISRMTSAVLDVEDPIGGEYNLEVSSPGLDRPLTRPKDFDRYAGLDARIELRLPMNGQKRFKGVLRGLDGDDVKLETGDGEIRLALGHIEKAKLILTDALIAAAQAQQAEELS